MNPHSLLDDTKRIIEELIIATQDPSKKFSKEQQNIVSTKTNKILALMGHIAIDLGEKNSKIEHLNMNKVLTEDTYAKRLSLNTRNFGETDADRNNLGRNEYCVMITPKNVNETAESLQRKLINRVKVSNYGIRVDSIKKISKNRLIVKCFSKVDAQKLSEAILKELDDAEALEMKKKKPHYHLKRCV
jgi:hypothetical protein